MSEKSGFFSFRKKNKKNKGDGKDGKSDEPTLVTGELNQIFTPAKARSAQTDDSQADGGQDRTQPGNAQAGAQSINAQAGGTQPGTANMQSAASAGTASAGAASNPFAGSSNVPPAPAGAQNRDSYKAAHAQASSQANTQAGSQTASANSDAGAFNPPSPKIPSVSEDSLAFPVSEGTGSRRAANAGESAAVSGATASGTTGNASANSAANSFTAAVTASVFPDAQTGNNGDSAANAAAGVAETAGASASGAASANTVSASTEISAFQAASQDVQVRDQSGEQVTNTAESAQFSQETSGTELVVISEKDQERQDAMALAKSMSLPFVDLNEYQIDTDVFARVPDELCRKNTLLPLSIINGRLAVAMADPGNFTAIDDLAAATGMPILPMVAIPAQITTSINRYLRANAELDEISSEIAAAAEPEFNLEESESEDSSPVARFVSLLINQAIDDHASDIHIEPGEDGLQVRYRIDGVLHIFQEAPKAMAAGVISRIKVMSEMDIGERRKPQDGRITVRHSGKKVDLRVASLPTVWGEKIVMRILSTPAGNLKVSDLDLSERNYKVYHGGYERPYGMVLITGPTGSGKSTTLYATLGDIARPEINIITVEDPVEFRMSGINQVQVNVKAGLTFAAALRSILRADPDVVLLGEIRDAETAKIAVEASLTGHLVLSTLHTNDAPSAVSRLVEMGVEPFLISSSLATVMAQRLARRLCNDCKKADTATEADLKLLGIEHEPGTPMPTVYRATGCRECSDTGYRGRVAIHQIMDVTPEIQTLISKNATTHEIEEAANKGGMTDLRTDGWQKVLQGITSVEEILRVTV